MRSLPSAELNADCDSHAALLEEGLQDAEQIQVHRRDIHVVDIIL
jgi:hypothetical protein